MPLVVMRLALPTDLRPPQRGLRNGVACLALAALSACSALGLTNADDGDDFLTVRNESTCTLALTFSAGIAGSAPNVTLAPGAGHQAPITGPGTLSAAVETAPPRSDVDGACSVTAVAENSEGTPRYRVVTAADPAGENSSQPIFPNADGTFTPIVLSVERR